MSATLNSSARLVLGALLALGTGELLTRQLDFGRRTFDPALGSLWDPATPVVFRMEGAAVSHWDAHGVRRSAAAVEDAPVRVLVLGDSFTEGLQVADDQVYTHKVQVALLNQGVRVRVLNASVAGNSVAEYIAYADAYRKVFDPAWVVVQAGERDFTVEAFDSAGPRLSLDGASLRITGAQPENPLESQGLERSARILRNRSSLAYVMMKRTLELREWWWREPPLFQASRGVPALPPPAPDDYGLEAQVAALVRAYEGRLTVLYTTPFYEPVGGDDPSAVDSRILQILRERGLSYVWMTPAYADLARRGLPATGFANTRPFEGHWNVDGHAAVAKALARELTGVLKTSGLL